MTDCIHLKVSVNPSYLWLLPMIYYFRIASLSYAPRTIHSHTGITFIVRVSWTIVSDCWSVRIYTLLHLVICTADILAKINDGTVDNLGVV